MAEEASVDRTALRMAEATLLRAEAAVERHNAQRTRSIKGDDLYLDDPERNELHARVSDARANLLECQADYVLHGDDQDPITEAEEAQA